MTAGPVPTIDIEDPGGHRVTVAPRSPDDRLGELAEALGVDRGADLAVDGRPVGRGQTLAVAGLVHGSRLETGRPTPGPTPGPTRGPAADRGGCPLTPPPAAPAVEPVVSIVCEAGPGAGVVVHLPPGRHVVGRAPSAAVVIADGALEPHHGLVVVDPEGSVTFVQLTGRVAPRIAGDPVVTPAGVPDGAVLVIGASRLRIGRRVGPAPGGAVLAPTPGDPWRRTLRRTTRPLSRWDPLPIRVPDAVGSPLRASSVGLIATGVSLVGSIAIAVLMRSPMYLLFGAVAVLASLGMFLAGRVGAFRDGRRAGATRERDVAAFAAAVRAQREERWRHHVAISPSLAEATTAATTLRGDVWTRRADHVDAFRVTLGWGSVEWTVVLDGPLDGDRPGAGSRRRGDLPAELAGIVAAAEHFEDAAVPTDLGPGAALAVAGPAAAAVIRSLVVQLATWVGPADWRLVVVADQPADWDWCRWLPHAASGDRARIVPADDADQVAGVLARLDDGDARHVVVVTDRPDLLAQRTGSLRRFVGTAPSVALVVAVPHGGVAPAVCAGLFDIGSIGLGRWWPDTSAANGGGAVHAAGLAPAAACAAARALAGLHDPEDPAGASSALSASVSLGALSARHGVGSIDDAIAIAAAWRSAGVDPVPAAALGLTADGVVEIDLARDGPHALIAGTTGSGKSELLRTLVVSLAARCSPDHLTFVLVDYKGGSTFDACAELPHTVGVVTDLDDRLAERALVSLDAEIRRRERILRAAGAADLTEYRMAVTGQDGAPMPRLVVVIDEFAALAAELPDFLSALVGIAQRGRSLGIHLVLATQRPAGVVSDDIRANTNLRIALRLQDVADGRDVVGDDGPARFPRGTPGRAMLRLGPNEHVVFQSARSTGAVVPTSEDGLRVVVGVDAAESATGSESELTVLVRSIRQAAALSDVVAPHRPWLPALPTRFDRAAVETLAIGAVGLVDMPAAQIRDELRWAPSDGNLVLVGSRRSGTSTALTSVVVAAGAGRSPDDVHLYVVDARGDEQLDRLARAPHCAGVVRPHERERLDRMLRRLEAEVDRRRAGVGRRRDPDVILAIDGLPALRAAIDGPLDTRAYDSLMRIVTEGSSVGIATVMTSERPAGVPAAMLASCAQRWVFHLDDPTDAAACGVPAACVPPAVPGRLVVAATRLEAQIAPLPVALLGTRPPGARSSRSPGTGTGPPAAGPAEIGVLAAEVVGSDLPPGTVAADGELELVVGIDFESLAPARLVVPDGEHVLVAGPARAGRSSALARLATSWRDAHRSGTVVVIAPTRRSPLASWPEVVDVPSAIAVLRDARPGVAHLLVVDDAERVDDHEGAL
ncbi:MAG: FtsK/SpoIIIE domain-containing protein, partial [Ilumatobacteraceae bacterium]